MRPGFSVTSAVLVVRIPEPGKNAIAQGELKVATWLVVNGGFAPAEGDAPHASSISNSAH
jgi:hypothetical protein